MARDLGRGFRLGGRGSWRDGVGLVNRGCNSDVWLFLPDYVTLSIVAASLTLAIFRSDCPAPPRVAAGLPRITSRVLLHTTYLYWHQDSLQPEYLQNQIFYAKSDSKLDI